ncbi:M90 family metallopeptidase [Nitratifractor sp.]
MHYYLALMQLVFLLMALFLAWQSWLYFRRLWRMKRIEKTSFPERYREYLEQIPQYRALSDEQRQRLEKKMLYFMVSKEFVGVKTEVTDEMKVLISFYACLMVLEIPGECYDPLRTILIYPHEVIAEQVQANGGIYRKEEMILEGQSAGETVVIAWHDAKREAYHPRRHNVIVHELAHVLDYEEGGFDGIPPLEASRYGEWSRVLWRRFKELQKRSWKNRDWGKYSLIGSYAASNEAEFFAVLSELYFQDPMSLKKHFPDLYEELRAFYRLDTAELFGRK